MNGTRGRQSQQRIPSVAPGVRLGISKPPPPPPTTKNKTTKTYKLPIGTIATEPAIALAVQPELQYQVQQQPQYQVEYIQPANQMQQERNYERGDIYRTAMEDAVAFTQANPQLRQILEAEGYREPKARAARVAPDGQQIAAAFNGIVPATFFAELEANNAEVARLVFASMSLKNAGGIALRMPKSRGLDGQLKKDTQQARRILRALRGAMQAKLFRGARFNAGLLEAKSRLSTLKKIGDPHGFIVQLRSYIRKYGSTNPGVVLQAATNRVDTGLDVAKNNIMAKVRGGLDRVANFPQTSTVEERAAIVAAKRAVAAEQATLGIPGGYQAAAVLPWTQFNRIA